MQVGYSDPVPLHGQGTEQGIKDTLGIALYCPMYLSQYIQ